MFNVFKKKESEPQNLNELLAEFKELERSFEKVSKELEKLKEDSRFYIQKVGMVRFSPFNNFGGNQSFVIALLDGQNSGIVISSLYTREGNRVYAKSIKAGVSEYSLSNEEKEAITRAIGAKNDYQA